MKTITREQIHCEDTVFSIETNSEGDRLVHILGYGYCADDGSKKDHRFVEYSFFYAAFADAMEMGLNQIEEECSEQFKQYITDCTYDEMMDIYLHYDNGQCPVPVGEVTADLSDGTYILMKEAS